MVKIKTISMVRNSIHYLLNPTQTKNLSNKEDKHYNLRNQAPLQDGWLLPSDFTNIKQNYKQKRIKVYSATEIPRERKALKDIGIAETKEVKGTPYTKKGKKYTPTFEAIRLKTDKKTLLTLWKSSKETKNIENRLYYFMNSEYFNNNKHVPKLLDNYLSKFIHEDPKIFSNYEKYKEYKYKKSFNLILSLPNYFFIYLEDLKEFEARHKTMKKLFPNATLFTTFFDFLSLLLRNEEENEEDKKEVQRLQEVYFKHFKNSIITDYYINNDFEKIKKEFKQLHKIRKDNQTTYYLVKPFIYKPLLSKHKIKT